VAIARKAHIEMPLCNRFGTTIHSGDIWELGTTATKKEFED
jgi:hypothetical protein